ncbi:cache domain-containing sensor histidine kinase [Alkalihalobacterium bogoriense]|uniref:cache domain-containing sensor histidine kinase n=1 Tax=Alkalihalobacterium bogoriense TaxID=246272 RepID=UPI00047DF8AD|nr:sensor histidine kinase [Alkalihalobacterium bogoriense]
MISKIISFKNYRLRTKLVVMYFILTVLPMALLGYVAYSHYTTSIEEQVGEYIPKLLEQANENIKNQLREIKELPDTIYNSSQVMSILRKDVYQNRSSLLQDQFFINNYLTRHYINGANPDILGVFIFSNNRQFQSVKVPYDQIDFQFPSLYYGENFEIEGNETVFLLPHQTALQFEGNPPYILLMKQLTDLENRKNLGTIAIAIEVSFLKDVVHKLNADEKASIWMMDHTGRIIYHTNPDLIGTIDVHSYDYPKINGSFRTKKEEKTRLISIDHLEQENWVLVHSVYVRHLTERTDLVRNITVMIFIILVLISTGLAILLSWNVSSPLQRLARSMKLVEKGNFNVDLSVERQDEVGMIANSTNKMIKEIRELIREKYHIQLKQKDAELYALQSQINPHFMYNTLETIAMAVEDDEKETVVQMVTILGRMLRFSISNKDDLIPIADEVAHVKDYLTIQKIRFEESLDFYITEKLNAKDVFTPKFILQPIVENVIKYAIIPGKVTTVEIGIETYTEKCRKQEGVLFTIKDNGSGMNEEVLYNIEQLLLADPMKKRDSRFGLVNVHARIALQFGEGYGLTITSDTSGTEVTIQIPLIKREEVHYNESLH